MWRAGSAANVAAHGLGIKLVSRMRNFMKKQMGLPIPTGISKHSRHRRRTGPGRARGTAPIDSAQTLHGSVRVRRRPPPAHIYRVEPARLLSVLDRGDTRIARPVRSGQRMAVVRIWGHMRRTAVYPLPLSQGTALGGIAPLSRADHFDVLARRQRIHPAPEARRNTPTARWTPAAQPRAVGIPCALDPPRATALGQPGLQTA